MNYFEIGIVAHQLRTSQAWRLFEHVHARAISVDDGSKGCNGNHIEVLKLLHAFDSEWVVILEDDAEPVEHFRSQVGRALAAAKTDIVSFYLGTSNPIHWQPTIERALAQVTNEHWLTSQFLLHGVAYAIRTTHLEKLIDWLDATTRIPIDEQISVYCRHNGVQVGYTWPSTCEHRDEISVIEKHPDGAPRLLPRKAWKVGTRNDWSSRSIPLS